MRINVLLRETNVSLLDLEGEWAGVDKGAYLLLQKGIIPKYAFGDFDSINKKELEALKRVVRIDTIPSEKDFSDTELCLLSLVNLGYTEIHVYGAFGGRIDHELMNIQLLQNEALIDTHIQFIDEQNTLFLLKSGTHELVNRGFKYVSFIPLFDDTMLSLKGFKYDGDKIRASIGSTLTVSNELINDSGKVETSKNILVIFSKD